MLCCVVLAARCVVVLCCAHCSMCYVMLVFDVLSDVLSVLSGVWRSGRRARPQLPPPSTTSGVDIHYTSTGQSAGYRVLVLVSLFISAPFSVSPGEWQRPVKNGSRFTAIMAGPSRARASHQPRPVSSGVMILINVIQTMNTKWPAVRTRRTLCPL